MATLSITDIRTTAANPRAIKNATQKRGVF
jgi:hypothetical protein